MSGGKVRLAKNFRSVLVTQAADRMVSNAMKRIASGQRGYDDVVPMRGTRDLFRWKPDDRRTIDEDLDLRVIFRYTDDGVEVVRVDYRDTVYAK